MRPIKRPSTVRLVLSRIARGVFYVFLAGGATAGYLNFYHFNVAPTKVKLQETGKEITRSELLELIMQQVVRSSQAK